MQQWGRWYSQAPVGGRYCRNKKKGPSPSGRKKTPTYRTVHPPTTDDAVHSPPTHRPNLYYIHTAEQQCSSTYIRTAEQQYAQQYIPGTRGAVRWLVLMKQEKAKKRLPRTERSTHPHRTKQCTLHPPTDQTFTTYSRTAAQQLVHQNSSAAVRTAQQNTTHHAPTNLPSTAVEQCSSI